MIVSETTGSAEYLMDDGKNGFSLMCLIPVHSKPAWVANRKKSYRIMVQNSSARTGQGGRICTRGPTSWFDSQSCNRFELARFGSKVKLVGDLRH